jgi:hypothetical protein
VGNVALQTGKKIYWDGPKLKALNAPNAEQYIKPTFIQGRLEIMDNKNRAFCSNANIVDIIFKGVL